MSPPVKMQTRAPAFLSECVQFWRARYGGGPKKQRAPCCVIDEALIQWRNHAAPHKSLLADLNF